MTKAQLVEALAAVDDEDEVQLASLSRQSQYGLPSYSLGQIYYDTDHSLVYIVEKKQEGYMPASQIIITEES